MSISSSSANKGMTARAVMARSTLKGGMMRKRVRILVIGSAFAMGLTAQPTAAVAAGCPGADISAQARAYPGSRADAVRSFRENALPGQNFGDIQSDYNHQACGHGSP